MWMNVLHHCMRSCRGSSPEEARRINRVHVRDGVKQETTEENTEFKESPGGICVVECELGQKARWGKMKEAKSNFILREAEKSNKLLPLPTRSFVSSYSFSSVTGAGGGIWICPPPTSPPPPPHLITKSSAVQTAENCRYESKRVHQPDDRQVL